ncbi:MAG: histidine--tRNA ligase [Chitinophagaceae bacterium]|nr:histidine--tRNA ligase [Chitinophagaceae bacterium]MCW5926196.1 histidine--tRNA ligase [Chitinophagaceae bacterium]
MSKPSLPQGTRDFGPEVVRKRNYIINTIKNIFELYGFSPLETPAMENLDTLMGKYGEEGDKLIFKILNNGLNDPKNIDKAKAAFENVLAGKNDRNLTERALKYDLTIPFARYVAMNHGQLTFPFKRYQVQPVWRADRPQKGRYREFYQCDADMVGSNSLLNEIELVAIYDAVFAKLGIQVDIKINNRKILAALAELCGNAEKLTDITVAIDKLDKIGLEKVQEELVSRGLDDDQVGMITGFLQITGSNTEKLDQLKKLLSESSVGAAGIADLEYILNYLPPTQSNVMIDLTLARGLNYYTGSIFEIKAKQVQMGSIGGGGRYDDLTGLFGVPHIPGVGISFGVDRIYDVLEELRLFPEGVHQGTRVLFFNLGETEAKKSFEYLQLLRNKGIPAEIYPEQAKFDKQFRYAERKQIAWAVMIGSRELENNTCNIKNLLEGAQETISLSKLVDYAF